jgi:hypothetical protein
MSIQKARILIEDRDGKGSTTAFVGPFINGICQTRQIAYDGVRWFVQANNRAPFRPVGESEVPPNVFSRFRNYVKSLYNIDKAS